MITANAFNKYIPRIKGYLEPISSDEAQELLNGHLPKIYESSQIFKDEYKDEYIMNLNNDYYVVRNVAPQSIVRIL